MDHTTTTILMLSSNSQATLSLRIDQEKRHVEEGLRRSLYFKQFRLETRNVVRPRDLRRAMLDVGPQIIHFSGHGMGEQGLVFEDEIGNTKLVDGAALADLFALFADRINCVVLNGCYSESQAKAIAQHIPYVIGMNQAIGDNAAIAFAVGFYDALGAGHSIEFAYQLGCAAIHMEGIAEHLTPVLLKQSTAGEATVEPKPVVPSPSDPTSSAASANQPVEVFISFSHKDDDLREELVMHLSNLKRQGKIAAWHDRAIEAGEEWEAQIKGKLESAGIILPLISPPFMYSDYCYDIEMQRAIERHDAGTARVIPIILRPCDWKGSPFSKLAVLPRDGKPVTQWSDRDSAFVDVVQGIRRAVESLLGSYVREELRQFQQSLDLSNENVARIEDQLIASKEAEYQRKLEEQLQREQQRKLEEQRQRQLEQQWQLEVKQSETFTVQMSLEPNLFLVGSESELVIKLDRANSSDNAICSFEVSFNEILGKELNILLTVDGFQLNDNNSANLPLDTNFSEGIFTEEFVHAARFHLTALRAGSAKVQATLFCGDRFKTESVN